MSYLKNNWLLTLIVISIIPLTYYHLLIFILPIKIFRLFLIILISLPSLIFITKYLYDKKLWTTFLVTFIFTVFAGLTAAAVDQNITTPSDGVWWALATITTIGHGDVVPTSLIGRILGLILAGAGIGIFVTVTANFLNIVHKKELEETAPTSTDEIYDDLPAAQQKEFRHINKRLDEICQELKRQQNKDK